MHLAQTVSNTRTWNQLKGAPTRHAQGRDMEKRRCICQRERDSARWKPKNKHSASRSSWQQAPISTTPQSRNRASEGYSAASISPPRLALGLASWTGTGLWSCRTGTVFLAGLTLSPPSLRGRQGHPETKVSRVNTLHGRGQHCAHKVV